MLGRDLMDEIARRTPGGVAMDLAECDITDPAACVRAVDSVRPRAVVNCAAWTNVPAAEQHRDAAFAVNADGAGNVARACGHALVRCVHVSTDFVFDGAKGAPYGEDDTPNPLNVYGQSKLEGERRVAFSAPDHAIVRTAWLYGAHGPSFVRAILEARRRSGPVRVVDDQVGSPTWTRDLARVLVDVALSSERGVFHATNSGHCSRHEQARLIFALTGCDPERVVAVRTDPGSVPRRPADSRLACGRLAAAGIAPMPAWDDALRRFLRSIGELK